MSILKANRIENLTTTDGGINVNNSGNVGIGTDSPARRFVVSGGSSEAVAQFTNDTSGDGQDDGFQILHFTSGLTRLLNRENGPTAFSTNNTERLRIDSSGRLLIGSSSAVTNVLTFAPAVQVEGTTANTSRIAAIRNAAATGAFPSFICGKSRGTSNGSYTIVQSGDKIGSVEFAGADGAKFLGACSILAEVDGTPGLNDMPGRMIFSTTADGANGPTERMRIDSSGNVGIGTASPAQQDGNNNPVVHLYHATSPVEFRAQRGNGCDAFFTARSAELQLGTNTNHRIEFRTNDTERMRLHAGGTLSVPTGIELGSGLDGTSANTLDDYEEGTFTPAFSFSNLSVSSYHTQQGSYIKVGHIVHVNVYVRFSGSDLSGTPSTGGAVYINLPFVAGTKYNDTQYLGEPAAIGRLAEFRGSNNSTDFDRIFNYIGHTSSSMYFAVNKQPASPQNTDFLYGMSEKSFNGLIGVANNFEYRHSFTYESSS